MTEEEIRDALLLTTCDTYDNSIPGSQEWKTWVFRLATVTLLAKVNQLEAEIALLKAPAAEHDV